MAKAPSERVKAAQKKAVEAGAERLTLTLYGDDADRWRDWLARYEGHGAKMQAFRDALAAATAGEVTPEQAARVLARHFKVRA
jgi:hypothetical protein